MRQRDRLWWALFAAGAAAWVTLLVGLYLGWRPPAMLLPGLATYGLALALGYHGLRIRPFWRNRTS
ncbi:hypothetical protein [Phytohabitans kaempferiae]|uniref:DUF2530 domain-containing protein n=1 Tax=Phytohabitans kaempferiae TaxID=1620943 RepID=A0ABV6MCD3_9ACTN